MKTVLITGAGRGIGLGLCQQFLQLGHHVIATVRGDVGKMALEQLDYDKQKASLEIKMLDVTDESSINRLVQSLEGMKIDVVVNNAGVYGGDHQQVDDLDFTAWAHTISVNTLAPMRLTLGLLPNLRRSKEGKVVNISSIMASMARVRGNAIAYRSSKTALNKSMQCLAYELQSENIGVYLVHPGWVKTDMGGPEADISIDTSVEGIAALIEAFDLQQSGRFWQYDGVELEW